jgi:hypothetical protein
MKEVIVGYVPRIPGLVWQDLRCPVGLRSWAIARTRLEILVRDGCGTVRGLRLGGSGAVRRAVRLKMVHDHLSRRIIDRFSNEPMRETSQC